MTSFEPFGLQHWLAMGVTIGLGVTMPLLVRHHCSPQTRHSIRKLLALCLVAYLVTSFVARTGIYDLPVRQNLPLHLCGASVALGAIMLWFQSYRLYEVVYFWGTGGSLAALLTPDLQYAFPHAFFWLFFIGHGLSLGAVVFATIVCGFRPRRASVPFALAATAVYALLIYAVNVVLGTNYLYLMHKPRQPSLIDYLGPWPWYILGLCALTVVAFAVCYLPFALNERRRAAQR